MRTLSILAIALALTVPASAEECTPTTSDPEIAFGGFYIDNDLCQVPEENTESYPGDGGCLFSIWTYEESNGIAGLQRGDEVVDDTCGGMIESDTLAFY